jgi:hypothetical protein
LALSVLLCWTVTRYARSALAKAKWRLHEAQESSNDGRALQPPNPSRT